MAVTLNASVRRRPEVMVANRGLVVAAVCGGLFACAPVYADEKQPVEKTYPVHFENAKWVDVFDWFASLTELKAEVNARPAGAVTLKPGKDRQFTSAEITDLLNEVLMKQKLLLIPNRKTFAVVSTEGKIDPKFIRTVELTALSHLGKTVLVEVTIPVTFDADDVADELKKVLTPFGEVVSAKGKSIVVRDTVGNILRLLKILEA
jgi:hypothetical protein